MVAFLKETDTFLGFDIESTGLNVDEARIVSASLIFYTPKNDNWEFYDFLINPSVKIPDSAVAIHGITNEAAAAGSDPFTELSRIRSIISDAWDEGIPLVGHNIGGYDLNLLNAELVRNELKPLKINGPVLDTMVMHRMLGNNKASLSVVSEYYSIVNQKAHNARADAVTSLFVLDKIKEIPFFKEKSLQALWVEQRSSHRMWCQKTKKYFEDLGKSFDNDGSWPVKLRWENG